MVNHPNARQIECTSLPSLSSREQNWQHLIVEQFQHPAGEGRTYYSNEHTICVSLAPRPVRLFQTQGDRSKTGAYMQGDCCITPAGIPFFARWESEDRFIQIRLASQFLQDVAQETIEKSDLTLMSEMHTRDRQLQAIAVMLLHELQQDHLGSGLYIESLANLLAVHLLRNYSTVQPRLPLYQGGLSDRQIMQVVEYIQAYLNQNIQLKDLAQMLNLSQFHFSRLFKQSLGITPYQYLMQQRVEKAQQLLKQTNDSITNIALECGFSSHSHFSLQFRQITGIAPKVYRANNQ